MVKKIGNFQLGKTLGSGTFGKVKYAVDTKDPAQTTYAVKMLNRKSIEEQGMEDQLKSEIAIMKMLSHQNVVKMFQVIQSASHVYIVLELITGGELFDRIVEKRRFQEPQARRYFQQLIFGVHYCHTRGVAHRDLKPENLLLDAHDNLKISDFGLSAIITKGKNGNDSLLNTTCGTPSYVAPEVLKSNAHGHGYDGMPVDLWSSGIILFVMLAGYLPFDDPSTNGLFLKIESGEFRMPRYFSAQAKHVIGNLIVVEPKKRWTTKDIMMDHWFREGLDSKVLQRNINIEFDNKDDANVEIHDVQETQEDTDKASTDVKVSAFELASNMVMGSLTPLVSSSANVRTGHQFVMNISLEEGIARLKTELEKLNAKPERGNKNNLKGYTEPTSKGVVTFVFQFTSTVCSTLTLCEARRMRGDTLQFHKFYRVLLKSIVDIVPSQPPEDDEVAE
mmetsp:Transcript_148977/g.260342  ORF Transcript_148977/g.260342 Transcript_148977/m.260342 type:complete len:448 (-) Transcript_148977:1922-3265(-)